MVRFKKCNIKKDVQYIFSAVFRDSRLILFGLKNSTGPIGRDKNGFVR